MISNRWREYTIVRDAQEWVEKAELIAVEEW
jgi:hypothetical protein